MEERLDCIWVNGAVVERFDAVSGAPPAASIKLGQELPVAPGRCFRDGPMGDGRTARGPATNEKDAIDRAHG
jgi:hypothetical protein